MVSIPSAGLGALQLCARRESARSASRVSIPSPGTRWLQPRAAEGMSLIALLFPSPTGSEAAATQPTTISAGKRAPFPSRRRAKRLQHGGWMQPNYAANTFPSRGRGLPRCFEPMVWTALASTISFHPIVGSRCNSLIGIRVTSSKTCFHLVAGRSGCHSVRQVIEESGQDCFHPVPGEAAATLTLLSAARLPKSFHPVPGHTAGATYERQVHQQ